MMSKTAVYVEHTRVKDGVEEGRRRKRQSVVCRSSECRRYLRSYESAEVAARCYIQGCTKQ